MEPLTTEQLATLAQKVKAGTATNEETIQYLDIMNGLSEEFLSAIRSMPTDEQLMKAE